MNRFPKKPLLQVTGLRVGFQTREGEVSPVDGIDFEIHAGEIVGLIGESGSGKTMTGYSILSILPHPGGIRGGDIVFKGRSIIKLGEDEMRPLRGKEIAYIFQDPTTSLNPTKTVGWQIKHILEKKWGEETGSPNGWENAYKPRTLGLLKDVGILSPEAVMGLYPHNLSGGMLQRILIAMALSCSPDLIIADEPTTNLDVIVEAQILKLFLHFRAKFHTAILFISHDIGVIAETCDRVVVLYAGKIMERGSTRDILRSPVHPYTVGLLQSNPKIEDEGERLFQIRGELPTLHDLPLGCRFNPRCDRAMPICEKREPRLTKVNGDHLVACHLYE
jgi:oligopeptide/dipeptide ABC transporter ATP-binding protein